MRWVWRTLAIALLLPLLLWLGAEAVFRLTVPEPPALDADAATVAVNGSGHVRQSAHGWYQRHPSGLWEAYIEGEPYQRGLELGQLAMAQVREQEEHFVAQIRRLVPGTLLLRSLRYGVAWFNRDLNRHVPYEFQREIWGMSRAFDPKNDWIGPPYARVMNYHAAHDIGHALQDLSIVGCTSFAAWGSASADSSLIIGRNFDFYMGEDFARDKMVLFVRPDSGHAFASITWAGFMGVVSGMNEKGLTVTLNAAKSSVPTGSKTPISMLAREILQYACNISEAVAIAQGRETFVSESILIGSAADGRAVIIEKSPERIGVFQPDGNRMVCANHFQSEAFSNDSANAQFGRMSDSPYRFARMNGLLDSIGPVSAASAALILRTRTDAHGTDIGLGNPRSINQLIAHHAVIFRPEKRMMWVSTQPYQLGPMVCYDLNRVFGGQSADVNQPVAVDSLTIPSDPFAASVAFAGYAHFREVRQRIIGYTLLGQELDWDADQEAAFIRSNPNSYLTYLYLGDLHRAKGDRRAALAHYRKSLTLSVASLSEEQSIRQRIDECLKED